jgi:hypothetical protein
MRMRDCMYTQLQHLGISTQGCPVCHNNVCMTDLMLAEELVPKSIAPVTVRIKGTARLQSELEFKTARLPTSSTRMYAQCRHTCSLCKQYQECWHHAMPEPQMPIRRAHLWTGKVHVHQSTDKTRTVGIPWVYELSEGGDGDACGHLRADGTGGFSML